MYGPEFHLWEKSVVICKHVLLYIKGINTPQMNQSEGCAYVRPDTHRVFPLLCNFHCVNFPASRHMYQVLPGNWFVFVTLALLGMSVSSVVHVIGHSPTMAKNVFSDWYILDPDFKSLSTVATVPDYQSNQTCRCCDSFRYPILFGMSLSEPHTSRSTLQKCL